MVAIDALPPLHEPPAVPPDSEEVVEGHILKSPVMPAGVATTVAVIVRVQPEASVYVIVAFPAATPLSIPEVPTVAIPVLLLLHVPPADVLPRVADAPAHTLGVPVIAAIADTVTTAVVRQ